MPTDDCGEADLDGQVDNDGRRNINRRRQQLAVGKFVNMKDRWVVWVAHSGAAWVHDDLPLR
jgi:hypothetical protein